jgi:hypothetical protein
MQNISEKQEIVEVIETITDPGPRDTVVRKSIASLKIMADEDQPDEEKANTIHETMKLILSTGQIPVIPNKVEKDMFLTRVSQISIREYVREQFASIQDEDD